MSEDTTRVVDLPIKSTGNISLSDYLMGIDSAEGYQMLIGDLAKKIIETYTGSSVAGSAQTLKDALDGINTKIGSTTMGTTATTVTGAIKEHNDKIGDTTMGTTATTLTGAIAEHESDISTLNSNLTDALLKDTCTGSGTVNANTNAALIGNVPSHTGYTLLGVIGIFSNAGASACITDFGMLNNTQVRGVVRNVSSSQISVTLTFVLLFAKQSLM